MPDTVRTPNGTRGGFQARNWYMPALRVRGRQQAARVASCEAATSLEDPRAQARLELARYRALFHSEVGALEPLTRQFADDQGDLLSRRNMHGHITTSAFVLDTSAMKGLLIHHRLQNRWLHPGGHYGGGQLWTSAIREAIEETGILSPHRHQWSVMQGCPLDIESQAVPARPARGERPHVHHDFAYLASGDSRLPLMARFEEVFDARWVSLAVVAELGDSRLSRIVGKLENLGIVQPRARLS